MKFYDHHRKDLLQIIHSCGMDPLQCAFLKKKGRIVVQYSDSSQHFSYFERKKGVLVPSSMKILDNVTYEVRIDKGAIFIVENWNDVLIQFEAWTTKLKKSGV